MIYPDDRDSFTSLMFVTWQSCGRSTMPDKDTLRYWFEKLKKFENEEVADAFDKWLLSQRELPTFNDILKLCQHKVTIYAQLPSPLTVADNKRHAKEVQTFIAEKLQPTKDMKGWARVIVANPSNYSEIALRYAKEALFIKSD